MQLALAIVAVALLALGFLDEDVRPMLAGTLLFVLSEVINLGSLYRAAKSFRTGVPARFVRGGSGPVIPQWGDGVREGGGRLARE